MVGQVTSPFFYLYFIKKLVCYAQYFHVHVHVCSNARYFVQIKQLCVCCILQRYTMSCTIPLHNIQYNMIYIYDIPHCSNIPKMYTMTVYSVYTCTCIYIIHVGVGYITKFIAFCLHWSSSMTKLYVYRAVASYILITPNVFYVYGSMVTASCIYKPIHTFLKFEILTLLFRHQRYAMQLRN